tara:strand:- start:61 stop:168 length:108 start_codon:yes stop_codon:yes gene_type:complete
MNNKFISQVAAAVIAAIVSHYVTKALTDSQKVKVQ